MSSPQRIAIVVGGVVAVAAVAVGVWWFLWPPTPAAPPVVPPVAPPNGNPPVVKRHAIQLEYGSIGGAGYLVRAKGDTDATKPEAFWQGLLTEMAKDAATVPLLRKLFGGLRVQFVVLDGSPDKDDPVWRKKPGEGIDAVVRVANGGETLLRSVEGMTKAGKSVPVEYVVGSLSVGVVIDADPPADVLKSKGDPLDPPDDRQALKLAAEDHLLRRQASWRGLHVGSFGEYDEFNRVAENAKQTPEEARKDLDARIDDYARRYREYLGGVR